MYDFSRDLTHQEYLEMTREEFEATIAHVFPHATTGDVIRNELGDWETEVLIPGSSRTWPVTVCFGSWGLNFDTGDTLAEAADKWQAAVQRVIDATKPNLDAFKKARGIPA